MSFSPLSRSDLSVNDLGRSMLKPRWIFGIAVVLVTLITLFAHTTSHSVSGLVTSLSNTVSLSLAILPCVQCSDTAPEAFVTRTDTLVTQAVNWYWQSWSPLPDPGHEQQSRLLQTPPLLDHPRLPNTCPHQLGCARRGQSLQAASRKGRDASGIPQEAKAHKQGG